MQHYKDNFEYSKLLVYLCYHCHCDCAYHSSHHSSCLQQKEEGKTRGTCDKIEER